MLSKRTITFSISLFFMILQPLLQAKGNNDTIPSIKSPGCASLKQWHISCALLAMSTILYYSTSEKHEQRNIIDQVKPHTLIPHALMEYSLWFLTTLAHEYGHVLVHKLWHNKSSTVHIGTDCSSSKPPLLTTPLAHIDGIWPMLGYTQPINNDTLKNELLAITKKYSDQLSHCSSKNAAITLLTASNEYKELSAKHQLSHSYKIAQALSGGAMGIVANKLLRYLLNQASHTQHTQKLDPITLYHLINMFIPVSKNSDAAMLWKDVVLAPDWAIHYIEEIAPLIFIGAELYCSINTNKIGNPLSAVAQGMINYVLQGFVRLS